MKTRSEESHKNAKITAAGTDVTAGPTTNSPLHPVQSTSPAKMSCVCVSHVCTCTQKHTYIPALKATPVPRWQMDIAMGRDQLQRNTQRQFRKGKDDTTVKSSPLRQRELNRFGNGHYLNTTAFALLFPLSSLKTRKLIDLRSLLPLYQTVPLRELKRGTD